MPLATPILDKRRYQELLAEALARIPVHTPEWTNFGPADPGVTLIETFAFLTENLLYVANQTPERNRQKFLALLGIPLSAGSAARGLVTIANDSGPLETRTIAAGLEARAGDIAFKTDRTMDVLPLEGRCYLKRPFVDATGERVRQFQQLYASLKQEQPPADTEVILYETVAWDGARDDAVDIGKDTVDGCLWLALLARTADRDPANMAAKRQEIRGKLTGKTLSLAIVPAMDVSSRRLGPNQATGEPTPDVLRFDLPRPPSDGKLPPEPQRRDATYGKLNATERSDVLVEPGTVEITLPSAASDLGLWTDLDPLEAGSGDFPPTLDDTAMAERVVTWVRISCPGGIARLAWVGINGVAVEQRSPVINEVLADGSGEPGQQRSLAQAPVIASTVRVFVSNSQGTWDEWHAIDDLFAAAPEISVASSRRGPWDKAIPAAAGDANVFLLDAEAGTIRFGDGLRGRRPPAGARLRASYDGCRGIAGNVAVGAINSAHDLPAGFSIGNPLRTWGGVAPETTSEGEKQVTRYLQHHDRLVTAADFDAIARRTPGIDVGRVEVLPSFNPDLQPEAPGNSPGTVTLMVIPRYDPQHLNAPEPDRQFINALCKHLDPRRLVTTELLLRGPRYRDLWVGVGIEILSAGSSAPQVREAAKREVLDFLAPLGAAGLAPTTGDFLPPAKTGWPLWRAVSAAELTAVVSRVAGVRYVRGLRLYDARGTEHAEMPMQGLDLPRVAGILVVAGDVPAAADLMNAPVGGSLGGPGGSASPPKRIVPVPVIPETC